MKRIDLFGSVYTLAKVNITKISHKEILALKSKDYGKLYVQSRSYHTYQNMWSDSLIFKKVSFADLYYYHRLSPPVKKGLHLFGLLDI